MELCSLKANNAIFTQHSIIFPACVNLYIIKRVSIWKTKGANRSLEKAMML